MKNRFLQLGAAVLIITATVHLSGCSKKEIANAGSQPSTEVIQAVSAEPKDTTFGPYPADYKIAYFSLLGSSLNPTVKVLFSPGTSFVTSVEGSPATVAFEKASGSEKEFSAQLLLTIDTMKFMRMQVKFQSDDMGEMSYLRYLKLVNLINGNTTEKISRGTQNSDVEILGFFVGVMEYFWDMGKLNG